MNAELQALKERRSVRKYKADMVPQELIDQVIDAGLYAASGHGTQEVIIVAVTNKEVRDKLAKMNREILGTNSDSFYGAPVVLVVLGPKSNKLTPYDGSLVMGNLMQAAHAVGLGSCWINRAKEEFASEEGKQLLKEWGIEGEYEGVGHCILGYADGPVPQAAPRKTNRVFYVK
jgi:nitroreductase